MSTTDPGISVLVASMGRSSLQDLLGTIAWQMEPQDELLVDVNDDAPWGHRARNRLMPRARRGNGLVFYDDDDLVLPGALTAIRDAYRQNADVMHIFRMRHGPTHIWREPLVRQGNVSTQMVCVPAEQAVFSKWSDRYEGDYDFIVGIVRTFGEPTWHDTIVAHHNGAR